MTIQLINQIDTRGLVPELMALCAAAMPTEACGLIVDVGGTWQVLPCTNVLGPQTGRDRFAISAADYCAAEDLGTLVAVWHSHPNASAEPSAADRVSCTASGLPWLIIGYPCEVMRAIHPGYVAPLIGREFHHGVLDCYTLIQDHFDTQLGIKLPSFERADEWWKKGQHLYTDNFALAGFVEVSEAQVGDVILMQIMSNVPNHAAVLVRPGVILHHLYGRLSCEDVYTPTSYWARHTTHVLRHTSRQCPAAQQT